MLTDVSGTYSSKGDLSRWSESISLVNKATQRNLGKLNKLSLDKPPKPLRSSFSNIPSVLDNQNDMNMRPTMYNNYLPNHSVGDTLATVDRYQNSLISRSLSPNRGNRFFSNNDIFFQTQTNRQRQPSPSMQNFLRPSEDFYFKDMRAQTPENIASELDYKVNLEKAKDNLELFSKALENNLKYII